MVPFTIISSVPFYQDDILRVQEHHTSGDFAVLASDNNGARIVALRFNRQDLENLADMLDVTLDRPPRAP